MNAPHISIIVPIYNGERYIRECIHSIQAQTFTDFECILVNDNSSDKCPEICDEYAKQDIRIKIIHKAQNEGASLARRIGLEKSLGSYVLFIDCDDWIEKNMLKILYAKAISGDYEIVVCDCFYHKEKNIETLKQKFSGFDTIAIIKDILSLRVRTFLVNKLVRRDLYLQAQFPIYSRSEDYVITIQNIYNSKKTGYVDMPLYNYRYNAQSLSNNIEIMIRGRIEENRNWCILLNFLKEKYGDLKIFEPELSNRINSFRKIYMQNNELRNTSELNELFEIYRGMNFWYWSIVKQVKAKIKKILPIKTFEKIKKHKDKTSNSRLGEKHEAKN